MLSYLSPAEEQRGQQALRWYRYLSWALTSGMYLWGMPSYNLDIAIGVSVALLLAGHLASNFYQTSGDNRRLAIWLVFIETAGIALLLIPTGGLASPFIWYTLNPIFMAALRLSSKYCWVVLASFLGAATVGSVALFQERLVDVWSGRGWLISAFLMITASASIFAYLMNGLRDAYAQLNQAHAEAERLAIVEEQNRIAGEIHDGVSQHLFSIVYALHSLGSQTVNIQAEEIQDQLRLLSSTATLAAQELRASIYRIKPTTASGDAFVTTLTSYLDDLMKLNDVIINLEARGSEDAVSPALRQAITRILKEAVANAIRHGRCATVDIELIMQPGALRLEIVDDGVGFDSELTPQRSGLGLANMSGLMANFGGSFHISSTPGGGTRVFCSIPAATND